jgi:hypothetical protein
MRGGSIDSENSDSDAISIALETLKSRTCSHIGLPSIPTGPRVRQHMRLPFNVNLVDGNTCHARYL